MFDMFHSAKAVQGNVPILSGAATLTGDAIDRQGYMSAMLVVSVGAATGTPSSFTVDVHLHESTASGSGFDNCETDVGTTSITQITTENQIVMLRVNLQNAERYLKVITDVTVSGGSSPKVPVSTVLLLGDADTNPQS